ncbi:MAG: helix-turn-helix domain-containing protein, partial [Natronosporangium sp.]
MTSHGGPGAPPPLGSLLRRLRQSRGWSQLRLAEELCVVSGTATVGRHEVSRWERGDRVPGAHWLGWLAVALATELEPLEVAAAAQQKPPARGPLPAPAGWLWTPPVGLDLLPALDHGAVRDVLDISHAWLAGPPELTGTPGDAGSDPDLPDGTGRDLIGRLRARLHRLRRADDLVGGVDLAVRVNHRLRQSIRLLARLGGGRLRRPSLR